MSKSSEHLAAMREVLRHLNHPHRLAKNALIRWHFLDADEPALGAARVRHAVERAIEAAPARQREIVRRCDLRGDPHASVIRDLGISERHFYRERRSALESIAQRLAAPRQPATTALRADIPRQRLALQIGFVEAARQVGDIPRAAELLTNATASAALAERSHIECYLAELYCDSGAINEAHRCLRNAKETRLYLMDAADHSSAQCDAVEAAIAWRLGRVAAATTSANRVVGTLQESVARRGSAADTRALALSLLVLSEIDVAQGRWRAGRRHAWEACNAIEQTDFAFASIKARAALAASFASMFNPAKLHETVFELEGQYRSAVSTGLTLEAVLVRLHLSLAHRFARAPRKAIAALEDILPIADRVLPMEQRAIVRLELAQAYVLCGDPTKAHRFVAEARSRVLPGGATSSFVTLISAAAYLSQSQYQRALALAKSAFTAMTDLGVVTSIGEALRIQAEAMYALGEVSDARHLIRSALNGVGAGGHFFTVARTHQSAGRITGDRRHLGVARAILANVQQPS